jgi:NAD(P)-dependent dehydrogenase (short-subunit alcohol dehydrogenase family)
MRFQNRTAIVTGGTGALGSVVAEHFAEEGAGVAIPYSSEKSLGAVSQKLRQRSDKLLLMKCDLTDEAQVQSFADEVMKKFASIDFLINTAGGYVGGKLIDDVTLDEWDGIMKLNLRSTFLACRSALHVMRKQNAGRIVNIAAMPALSPSAKRGPYAVSKRGVITLTETIAEEVKGTGITANAIAPSIILTEANKQSMPNADFTKWVTPEEIARLILYLCLDDARSVNGNVVRIFGGV